jgi:cysteine synthase
MPASISQEWIDTVRSLGANIILFAKEKDGFLDVIRWSEEMTAADSRVFSSPQFANQYNTTQRPTPDTFVDELIWAGQL